MLLGGDRGGMARETLGASRLLRIGAIFANSAGCRKLLQSTKCPSLSRVVCARRKLASVHPSSATPAVTGVLAAQARVRAVTAAAIVGTIPVMLPARLRRSTKKRSRKRSDRPRQSWPVPAAAGKA